MGERQNFREALRGYARLVEKIGVEFTLTELRILNRFFESAGGAVRREDLIEDLWTGRSVHPKNVDVHLFNLRRKLLSTGLKVEYVPELQIWKLTDEAGEDEGDNWENNGVRRKVL